MAYSWATERPTKDKEAMMTAKLIYRITTGLLTLLMIGGAGTYFFNHDMVAEKFVALGYPTYIVYPLATAKLLGLLAIWTRKSRVLADLAYAGFFYDLILATAAHLAIGDGEFVPALVGLAIVVASYASGATARAQAA